MTYRVNTYLSIRHLLTKAVERLVLIVFVFISVPLLYVILPLGILIGPRQFRLYLSPTRRRRPMRLLLRKPRTLRNDRNGRGDWAGLLDGGSSRQRGNLSLYVIRGRK
jgi:hypothetical protein